MDNQHSTSSTLGNDSRPLRVAIQGIAGCFHDAAARGYFGDAEVHPVEFDSFPEMFDGLADDASMLGLMAIDNTIAGSILPNHELLRRSPLRIIGEYKMRISHVLCALPGETLDTVTEAHSHPMALMQCEQYLRRHGHIRMIEDFDTAGAARNISRDHLAHTAAVCGELAAELYGLNVLECGIETNKRNFTRFLVLADPLVASELAPRDADVNKASIVFTLPHTQGALSKILTIFAFYDLNLSKIQSLPIIGREWEYRFYVDLTFDSAVRYHQALAAVRPLMNDFRVLGEYTEFVEQTKS